MDKPTRRFVGYSEPQIEQMKAALAGRVTDAPSPLSRFSDVLVMPAVRFALGQFAGGAYSRGHYLEQLRLRRADNFHMSPADVPLADPATRLGSAWYAGPLFDHYGHFILESISRLTDRRVIESEDPIIFLNVNKLAALRPYMHDVLSWLGIRPSRAVLVSEALGVEHLSAIAPNFVIRHSINAYMRTALQKPIHAVPSGVLYLSRSKVKRHRVVANEEALETLVTGLGGQVVHPETLPFAAQVEALGKAHTVIAVEGSALHTLMFAAGPRRAITLSAGRPSLSFLLQDELSDRESIYINAIAGAGSMDRKNWSVTPALLRSLEDVLGDGATGVIDGSH